VLLLLLTIAVAEVLAIPPDEVWSRLADADLRPARR